MWAWQIIANNVELVRSTADDKNLKKFHALIQQLITVFIIPGKTNIIVIALRMRFT